jgi:hypothetical protein
MKIIVTNSTYEALPPNKTAGKQADGMSAGAIYIARKVLDA